MPRRLACAVAWLLGVSALAQQSPDGGELPAAKAYAEDWHPALKSDKAEVAGLAVYGPDAADCVTFTPQGLRITLPADYPRQRAGTGVITAFGVGGDFEITLAYEIVQAPRRGATGNPTDLKLVIVPRDDIVPHEWQMANQNRAVLAREFVGVKSQYRADATAWHKGELPRDKWGNEQFDRIEAYTDRATATTTATSGRMRLVRSGPTLFYLVAEADREFTPLLKSDFGVKDLKNVRVLGGTGWMGVSFEVLVTDLQLRADRLIKTPPPAPIVAPPVESRIHWLMAAALVALSALLGFPLAAWLLLRRLRANDAVMAASTVRECPSCGKRLKWKNPQPGKKAKCPECGETVEL